MARLDPRLGAAGHVDGVDALRPEELGGPAAAGALGADDVDRALGGHLGEPLRHRRQGHERGAGDVGGSRTRPVRGRR